MPEYHIHILRTIIIYFTVFLVMRFMGKREIGKLSIFDLVISVMIAEIAVFAIEDVSRPIWDGIVPMAVLLLIQLSIAYLALKSRTLRLWFDGKPSPLIDRGKLNREQMKKQRYNLDDLMVQLRENQIASMKDVEFAILETSGKLSVIETEHAQRKKLEQKLHKLQQNELANADLQFPPGFRFEELPIPLIMDGKIQDDNLEKLGKNRFWLKMQLKLANVRSVEDVYLCTVDHEGELYITPQL